MSKDNTDKVNNQPAFRRTTPVEEIKSMLRTNKIITRSKPDSRADLELIYFVISLNWPR